MRVLGGGQGCMLGFQQEEGVFSVIRCCRDVLGGCELKWCDVVEVIGNFDESSF